MKTTCTLLMRIAVVLLFLSATAQKSPEPVSIMTFNIRYDNPADKPNDWPNRKDWVGELIGFYNPDFIGVQEALHRQLTDMQERMPQFTYFGAGRDDGKQEGEYSAIFYRKDKYDLLRSSTFWLSETPEQPGSKGWDAAFPRVVTWGEFKPKKSKRTFFVFNTHFDHMGVKAREESAKMLVAKVKELAGDKLSIIMGDFNSDPESQPYRILTGSFSDTYTVAPKPYDPKWTFHGFGNTPMNERKRIDFIFTNRKVKVNKHFSIAEQRGDVFPSDHLPVMAEILLE